MDNGIKLFTRWIPIIALACMGIAGWMTVRYQAQSSLSRTEAYKSFVTTERLDKIMLARDARLERIEDKLDRLLERVQ